MKNSKILNWIWWIFYQLRLEVIKLVVGNLSVIVNVKVYGWVMAGSYGLVYNSVFQSSDLPMANQYCVHVAAPSGAQVAVNHCVFDASGKEKE